MFYVVVNYIACKKKYLKNTRIISINWKLFVYKKIAQNTIKKIWFHFILMVPLTYSVDY